ncbi:hypothetical protein Tco_0208577, partial [Tanacetum coccineum]
MLSRFMTNVEKSSGVSMSSSNEVGGSGVRGLSGFLNRSLLEQPRHQVVPHCYPCRTLNSVALPSLQLCDLAPLHGQTCQIVI